MLLQRFTKGPKEQRKKHNLYKLHSNSIYGYWLVIGIHDSLVWCFLITLKLAKVKHLQLRDCDTALCHLHLEQNKKVPEKNIWLVVSTHLKNICQNGSFPQGTGVKIKNIRNHQLETCSTLIFGHGTASSLSTWVNRGWWGEKRPKISTRNRFSNLGNLIFQGFNW